MAQQKETRVNGEIDAREVRVVTDDNEQLGILTIGEALVQAEERGLDLVEIAPQAAPPVCRIMDYGKYKYQQSKRAHDARQKQKQIQVKEVKFRPGTDEGDYQVKLRNLTRFLEEGDKCKVTMRFRGREVVHQDLGLQLLRRVEEDLAELGVVEQRPRLDGRLLVMVLAPKKKV